VGDSDLLRAPVGRRGFVKGGALATGAFFINTAI
jgi:hypothetical protein